MMGFKPFKKLAIFVKSWQFNPKSWQFNPKSWQFNPKSWQFFNHIYKNRPLTQSLNKRSIKFIYLETC